MKLALLILTQLTIAANAFAVSGACVLPGRGHFQIHVGTAGLFGALAHNHLIEAEKISGCAAIDPKDLTHSSIKLDFPASNVRVIDPKESEKDRAEVQKTMETEVLRISEFPRIAFASTAIERTNEPDGFRVHGNLTIRGKTQPVTISVTLTRLSDATYRATGHTKFTQTSFGIKPIQLGGGTVKVKDELEIEFELFLR
jgi:polyisoprenoid-binding protein YceI